MSGEEESDTPQNIGGQLHRGQADISEAEGQAEELTEQRQRVLHFSVGNEKKKRREIKGEARRWMEKSGHTERDEATLLTRWVNMSAAPSEG